MSDESPRIPPVVKAIFFIVGGILSVTQLYDWFASSAPSLEAVVKYSDFVIPPVASNQSEYGHFGISSDIRSSQKYEKFAEKFSDSADRDQLKELTDFIIEKSVNEMPEILRKQMYMVRGQLNLTVANNGSHKAEGVRLKIPDLDRYVLRRDGQDEFIGTKEGPIKLGELQPQESVSIVAWTMYSPGLTTGYDIKLTHSAGIGEVTVLAPTGTLGQIIDRHWGFMLVLVLFLVPFVVLAYLDVKKTLKNEEQNSESNQPPNNQSDGSQQAGPVL